METEILKAKKQKNINISQVLIVQPPQRNVGDINTWKSAMAAADRGRRQQLVNLFDNLLIDTVLSESVDKRVRHITNGSLVFTANNKEVDEMTDLIKSPEFRKLLKEIILTRFYGKTVIELGFTPDFTTYSVPRTHLNTREKIITVRPSDTNGIAYENDDFLLNLGEDKDLGLFLKTAPHAIFKRNGGADYAQFCELFGIPVLAGFYDPDDENGRQEMESFFANRGGSTGVVTSKNSDIKTISGEPKNAVHDGFLAWCDEQIMIGLIGQTMTSKSGASHSQSKTHAETEDDINADDRIYVTESLNAYLLPILQKRGYPVGNGWFSYPAKDNLTQEEKMEIAEKVHNLTEDGVADDYFYETFGLPRGNKKERMEADNATEMEEEEENEDAETEGKPNKKKDETKPKPKAKGRKITAKELSFFEKLKDFFDLAPR